MSDLDDLRAAGVPENEIRDLMDAGVLAKAKLTPEQKSAVEKSARMKVETTPERRGERPEQGALRTLSLAGSGLWDSLGNADLGSVGDAARAFGDAAIGGEEAANKNLAFLGSVADRLNPYNPSDSLTGTYNERLAANRRSTEERNTRSPFATQIGAPAAYAALGAVKGGAQAAANAGRQGLQALGPLVGKGAAFGGSAAVANMEDPGLDLQTAKTGAKGALFGGGLAALGGARGIAAEVPASRFNPRIGFAPKAPMLTPEAASNVSTRGVDLPPLEEPPAGTLGEALRAGGQELRRGVAGAVDSAMNAGSETGALGRLARGALHAGPAALRAAMRARQGVVEPTTPQPNGALPQTTPFQEPSSYYDNPIVPGTEHVQFQSDRPTFLTNRVQPTPFEAGGEPYQSPFAGGNEPQPGGGSINATPWEAPSPAQPASGAPMTAVQENPLQSLAQLQEEVAKQPMAAWRAKHGSPQQPLDLPEPPTSLDWNSPKVHAAMGTAAELAITKGVMNPHVMLQYLRPYGIQTPEEAQAIMARALRD